MAEDRPNWLPIGLAAGLALAGVAAVLATAQFNDPAPTCATSVEASSAFVDPDRFGEDENLAALGAAVEKLGAPFGPVRTGVGYNYDQWLHLYGIPTGLLAFTKDNAALTVLDDESLEPRWAIEPKTKRIAWDASADRLALLDLSAKSEVRVGSFDLASGDEEWCVELSTRHRDGEPVSTAFLDDGDLLVVLPVESGLDVARLSGEDGHVRWWRELENAGRADFLTAISGNRFLVGGVEAFRLAEPRTKGEPLDGVATYSLKDGRREQNLPDVGRVHVVGRAGDDVLTLSRSGATSVLTSVGLEGEPRWSTDLLGGTLDVALRGGVVLARSPKVITGYDAATGKVLWTRPVPQDRTYIPYGFTLDQMPMLDEQHLLVPTTTSLLVLDVRAGKATEYPLPTDGVSTTYWPYQLVVTDQVLGVVTNTGGVLADRE